MLGIVILQYTVGTITVGGTIGGFQLAPLFLRNTMWSLSVGSMFLATIIAL